MAKGAFRIVKVHPAQILKANNTGKIRERFLAFGCLRVYNGKPIVNSVNGETEVLERVLPLCKKYGANNMKLLLPFRKYWQAY